MSDNDNQLRFDLYDSWPIPPRRQQGSYFINELPGHIWTNTKAQLIRNYLYYFQWVTKHGCYIDGFAGPQYTEEHDSWAAKLVLEMTPKWFRNFYLCELDQNSFQLIEQLINDQPVIKNRHIECKNSDFNLWIDEILNSGVITDSVATFALLDQRSTECDWETVEKLARHKKGETKIELFYFFPTGWINRVVSKKKEDSLVKWWGDNGWKIINKVSPSESAIEMNNKIINLGYEHVVAWPIYKKAKGGGRVMYHMIHATDHKQAPKLMEKAYVKLIGTDDQKRQIEMWESKNLKDN